MQAHSQLDLGLPCTGAKTDAFSSPLGTAMHTADGDPLARARARRAEVPNSGEHLVLHAMSRLATKLGRWVHRHSWAKLAALSRRGSVLASTSGSPSSLCLSALLACYPCLG